jgi:hypothetical protein
MKVIIGWNANDEENLGKIKSNQNIKYFTPILEEIQQKMKVFNLIYMYLNLEINMKLIKNYLD